eukprot:SAG31_NODE_1859_length_7052_cov_4.965051_7_plen_375_part_00
MPLSKYGKGLITLEEGAEKLGVSWGTVAVPDHEFSDRQYAGVHPPELGYRTLPLIDIVHPPGSAHEGQLSGHLLVVAGATVVTGVHLNVMGPRGRLTVKRQPVQDFETFRDLLDKRTAQLRAGAGGDLFKAFEVQACVSVVTQVHPNVMGPRGLANADCRRESQEFKTLCDLLASAGVGLPARLVCVPMDETGNALRRKNDPADDPANINPTESGAPLAICDQVEQVLTKPMATLNMRQPQVVHDVVDPPVGCRNLSLIDTLHPPGNTNEGKLSGYFLGAHVSVGNASRGENDPADGAANIDPSERDARLAICDQVEPVLTKPMTAFNTYSSRSAPDLATSRLKVAAQSVGALVLIMLMSTFALGMIAAVRIYL